MSLPRGAVAFRKQVPVPHPCGGCELAEPVKRVSLKRNLTQEQRGSQVNEKAILGTRLRYAGEFGGVILTLYKRGGVWWYEFVLSGQRIRESTKLRNKELARKVEAAHRDAMALAAAGVDPAPKPMLFNKAVEAYLLDREPHWSAKTQEMHRNSSVHLETHFARLLVGAVKPEHISRYQRARLKEGASPKSVNLEVELLRLILKKHKRWSTVAAEVTMLRVRKDRGRELSDDEMHRLLIAVKASTSRSLYPAIVVSTHTGLRNKELRLLRWRQVDLVDGSVTVGQSKTEGGEGRRVPLSDTALQTLKDWRVRFPDSHPEHFVFPSERYGLIGEKGTFGGKMAPYETFPDTPIGSWKSAWKQAKKVAQIECRWHDLRHTAVSRVAAGGATDGTLQAIFGWMSPAMIGRYSHVRNEAMRKAVSVLDRPQNTPTLEKSTSTPNISKRPQEQSPTPTKIPT
jgi:integrase